MCRLLLHVSLLILAAGGLTGCGSTPEPSGPPNIVLVSLDTFRADRVGVYGNPDGLTPNLDRFAEQAVLFTNAHSQAPTTGPSHASLFTSRYPRELAGPGGGPSLAKGMYSLPEVLGTYGYQTAARVAGGQLNPAMASTRGFDTYESSVDFGSLWHTLPMAVDWLDSADPAKPFFLFLHGYDTHPTYLKPTPFGLISTDVTDITPAQIRTLQNPEGVVDGMRHLNHRALEVVTNTMLRPRSVEGRKALAELATEYGPPLQAVPGDELELIASTYDGAVSYADLQFGLLLARLDARGRLDDTVVVVLSDHGESLGENGMYNRCCDLHDGVTHVPLLIRLPRGERGGTRVDAMVELVDIMPTLLELGGAVPPAGVKGVSLAPALRGEPFPGRRVSVTQASPGNRLLSVRSESGRLSYTGVPSRSDVLADIVAAAGLPGPAFSATEGMEVAEQSALRDEMVRWLTAVPPPVFEGEEAVTPPELLETLRAKGYWDVR